ncbi:MAG: FtsQ-type POTRA domain-containing protein [Myxococcota bacterium]
MTKISRQRPLRRKRNRRMAQERPALASQLKAAFSLFLGLVALGGAVLGVHYGWKCLVTSGRLQIQDIHISGNHFTDVAEISAYVGVRKGDFILDVDLDAVAVGLRRHPWIKNASVHRRLLDQITIVVEEEEPVLLVSLGDVYLANQEGTLFKRVSSRDQVVLPLLTGIAKERIHSEQESVAKIVRDAVALKLAIEGTKLGALEELHWDEALGWSIVTQPDQNRQPALRVHLGNDPVSRIDTAVHALRRINRLHRTASTIWVDSPTNPDRVHVRFVRQEHSKETEHSNEAENLIAKAGHDGR